MIPRVRAIAIDDELDHLQQITNAITRLGIGCLPLHHPADTQNLNTELLESIRLVFSDLYLSPAEAFAAGDAQLKQVASQLLALGLKGHCPYVLVLWTTHAREKEALVAVLEDEKLFPAESRPLSVVALDKNKYGVGIAGQHVNEQLLWDDVKAAIKSSHALNALLIWERDVIRAADASVRTLVDIARVGAAEKKISIDQEMDELLSILAISATSSQQAIDSTRSALGEGMSGLLFDELQHLGADAVTDEFWKVGLTGVLKPKDASSEERRRLNEALLISRTPCDASMRGSVVDVWLTDQQFQEQFGVPPAEMARNFAFKGQPEIKWRLVQIEGVCDAAQNKPGLLPFVLAAEVDASTDHAGKAPAHLLSTPQFAEGKATRKLVISYRFFLTEPRTVSKARAAAYRLREGLTNTIAAGWASHLTRPGFVYVP